jgi:hypothetical protein
MADYYTIINALIGFVGAIIGGMITLLLGPWMAEKFKLREQYFVPFKKWCARFYGDLEEFNHRYIKNSPDYTEFSDILVILDYRSLHEGLIDSSQWFGSVKRENLSVFYKLEELLETVEKFWHHLENTYPLDLQSVETTKEFNKSIKSLPNERRNEIAQSIRKHLGEGKYNPDDINEILKYLIGQIPKP